MWGCGGGGFVKAEGEQGLVGVRVLLMLFPERWSHHEQILPRLSLCLTLQGVCVYMLNHVHN